MIPYRYEASARGPRAVLAVALWWGLIAFGLWAIALNPWIALVLWLISLPAAWELLRNVQFWLEVTPQAIRWGSGETDICVPLDRLEDVRFDTRLDLSVRVTLRLTTGDKIRIPDGCLPRAARLKPALDAVGVTYQHHHFTLMS